MAGMGRELYREVSHFFIEVLAQLYTQAVERVDFS